MSTLTEFLRTALGELISVVITVASVLVLIVVRRCISLFSNLKKVEAKTEE